MTQPKHDLLYLGGEWRAPHGHEAIEVVNAATELAMSAVPAGDEADVDAAVSAAAEAFPTWSETSPQQRAALLRALAGVLERHNEALAQSITDEVGTPIRTSQRIQAVLPVTVLNAYADQLEQGRPEEKIGNTMVLREPVGVVAAITPWNYPLHQVVAKLAPALAAGCTLVLKPSEVAPLTAWMLAEAVDEVGLPAGVFNLVSGTGPVVGEALSRHPRVDAVSFTGSMRAGTRVAALAAETVKRVTLELGGKSANVVLDDADLSLAVKVGIANAFLNNGQTCAAWTRLLVPRSRHAEACALARTYAEAFSPGDPRDARTRLGPLASRMQRDIVRSYIAAGVDDGAELITGGAEQPEGLDCGFYVRPTVFGSVDPAARIAQEEIFGPVLSIIAHDGDDDAVRIANDSDYGLHGAVWSADQNRAFAVARRMRTGTVDINGAAYNPLAPFGGYKRSGLGREMGPYGLEDYLELKSIQI
ncbi:aldehyde dehydrogenase family protein [Nocardioides sp.]|uniref:aldehyde dehydrogenase family protein n=1 Tax=Nocardioides sp. TaxID=35761 RepID=UPI003D0B4779